MMKQIRNQNGLSLVEVLVAAGLTAVVSLGIATMIQNSMVEQKKTVLLNTLRENKTRIENLLRDQLAWQNTMNDATNLGITPANQSTTCLRDSSACAEIAATAPKKLVIRDGSNAVVYNLLDWAGTGSNGLTEGGGACTTFSATTGTDACPISYKIVYMYSCASGTSCVNPEIKIVARLVFNPSSSGVLNRFRNLIAAGNMTSIAGEDAQNLGKYDAIVKRRAVQTNREFRLAQRFVGTAGDCSTGGAGTCSPGTFANYNRTWFEDDGLWNLVDVSGLNFTPTAGNDGPYSCTVTAQAFSTGGFSIQIYDVTGGAPIATANTTAGLWAMSTAVLETKFIMQAGRNYTVRQMCSALPVGDTPSADNCTLGIAQNYGSNTDYVTVTCYKVDM